MFNASASKCIPHCPSHLRLLICFQLLQVDACNACIQGPWHLSSLCQRMAVIWLWAALVSQGSSFAAFAERDNACAAKLVLASVAADQEALLDLITWIVIPFFTARHNTFSKTRIGATQKVRHSMDKALKGGRGRGGMCNLD